MSTKGRIDKEFLAEWAQFETMAQTAKYNTKELRDICEWFYVKGRLTESILRLKEHTNQEALKI